MKPIGLAGIPVVVLTLLSLFVSCKKEEDFARKFEGNYRGTTTVYVSLSLTVLNTFPDRRVKITQVDRNTIEIKVFGDSVQNFVAARYTVNKSNGFGHTNSSRIGSTGTSGRLDGDSLTYGSFSSGSYANTDWHFKGVRY